jgi:hypothetical protein
VKGIKRALLLVGLMAQNSFLLAAEDVEQPLLSIKQVMESVITPATNTLWEIYEPTTDDDWQRLEQAAITTITAAVLTGQGGSGENDMKSVKEPAYQVFNQLVIKAASDALVAIQNRDVDAFLKASDELYPPCESCHLTYNPGVANQ